MNNPNKIADLLEQLQKSGATIKENPTAANPEGSHLLRSNTLTALRDAATTSGRSVAKLKVKNWVDWESGV